MFDLATRVDVEREKADLRHRLGVLGLPFTESADKINLSVEEQHVEYEFSDHQISAFCTHKYTLSFLLESIELDWRVPLQPLDIPLTRVGIRGRGLGVDIMRPGPWGNPIGFDCVCLVCRSPHSTWDRLGLLRCYKVWLLRQSGAWKATAVQQLRNQWLRCCCKPKACHGDVLADFVDGVFDT
jgi:hypothetical protein